MQIQTQSVPLLVAVLMANFFLPASMRKEGSTPTSSTFSSLLDHSKLSQPWNHYSRQIQSTSNFVYLPTTAHAGSHYPERHEGYYYYKDQNNNGNVNRQTDFQLDNFAGGTGPTGGTGTTGGGGGGGTDLGGILGAIGLPGLLGLKGLKGLIPLALLLPFLPFLPIIIPALLLPLLAPLLLLLLLIPVPVVVIPPIGTIPVPNPLCLPTTPVPPCSACTIAEVCTCPTLTDSCSCDGTACTCGAAPGTPPGCVAIPVGRSRDVVSFLDPKYHRNHGNMTAWG